MDVLTLFIQEANLASFGYYWGIRGEFEGNSRGFEGDSRGFEGDSRGINKNLPEIFPFEMCLIIYTYMAEHSLDNLKVFQKAVFISDHAWEILDLIPKPFRNSTGDQFLRSADSIAANIAEGYGRFGFKDKRKFFHNARGSLYECRTWFGQICKRFHIPKESQDAMSKELDNLGYLINQYIRYLNSQMGKT